MQTVFFNAIFHEGHSSASRSLWRLLGRGFLHLLLQKKEEDDPFKRVRTNRQGNLQRAGADPGSRQRERERERKRERERERERETHRERERETQREDPRRLNERKFCLLLWFGVTSASTGKLVQVLFLCMGANRAWALRLYEC